MPSGYTSKDYLNFYLADSKFPFNKYPVPKWYKNCYLNKIGIYVLSKALHKVIDLKFVIYFI
jgi:hypothetical protein